MIDEFLFLITYFVSFLDSTYIRQQLLENLKIPIFILQKSNMCNYNILTKHIKFEMLQLLHATCTFVM